MTQRADLMPYSEFSGIDVGREVSVGVYGVDSGQIIRRRQGERIRVTLAPMIAPAAEGRMVLLHVFHELAEAESGAAGDGRLFDITPDVVAAAAPAGAAALTGRDLEALRLMAAGMTNGEIAENLIISYHTVRNHVSSIREKLQARNRQQATIIAGNLGLI